MLWPCCAFEKKNMYGAVDMALFHRKKQTKKLCQEDKISERSEEKKPKHING